MVLQDKESRISFLRFYFSHLRKTLMWNLNQLTIKVEVCIYMLQLLFYVLLLVVEVLLIHSLQKLLYYYFFSNHGNVQWSHTIAETNQVAVMQMTFCQNMRHCKMAKSLQYIQCHLFIMKY